jgi:nuclear control of ATPase protein 2
MSVVLDRVAALNHQLNSNPPTRQHPPPLTPYLTHLQTSLSLLSSTSPSSLTSIARLLLELNQLKQAEAPSTLTAEYTQDLEWFVLGHCAVAVYANILDRLFSQTLPLARDIFYWEGVLSQPHWRVLFLIQSNPCLEFN